MTFPSHAMSQPLIPVLIPSESVFLARQLAQQQPLPEQAQQVYRNLIAVFALKHYLDVLGIETDLTTCDCWNSFLRLTLNRADVSVVGHGRLECCVVSSADVEAASEVTVPSEILEDRIGYVAVQIEADLNQASEVTALFLGFVPQTENLPVRLDALGSMFDLPEFLADQTQAPLVTQLSHWFHSTVEQGWQALDKILGFDLQPQLQMRSAPAKSGMTRQVYGKSLVLSKVEHPVSVALVADVTHRSDGQYAVELKVCPTTEEDFLPPSLDMIVMDEVGEVVMQAQARFQNRMMELGFLAEPGDRFQLQVKLDDQVWIESFVI